MRQPSIRRGVRTRLVIFGILALLLFLFSAFSAYLTPYDPYLQDLSQAKAPPSAEHLLGTDRYGRDMLSRVIVGSRTSIFSTLLLVAAVTVLGTAVGLCGGFFGGWADTVLMRVSDIFLAFPGLVFALAVAGALGGGLHNAILALAAVSWPKYARLARSQTLARREAPWMQAARLSGSRTTRYKVAAYVIASLLAGLGGILLASRIGSSQVNAGGGYLMDAVAAAWIGFSLAGSGKPNALGTLVGAVILGVLSNGLVMLSVPYYAMDIIKGLVLAVALAITYIQKR